MSLQIGFISIIIGAVILSCSSHIITQQQLQKSSSPLIESRIIGGSEESEGQIPYIVAINNTFGEHICGGSILTSKYVLTAAHCLQLPEKFLLVLTGAVYLNAPDAVHTVKEKIVHCSYNKPWMHSDIGLILLETEIIFNSLTQPIQMASDDDLNKDEPLNLSGWGAVRTYGRSSPVLKTAVVTFISKATCAKAVKTKKWLGPANICTSTKKSTGSCNNDSGGPLVSAKGQLVGVVNWGEACATGRPDVFSSVAYHQEFINNVVKGRRGC